MQIKRIRSAYHVDRFFAVQSRSLNGLASSYYFYCTYCNVRTQPDELVLYFLRAYVHPREPFFCQTEYKTPCLTKFSTTLIALTRAEFCRLQKCSDDNPKVEMEGKSLFPPGECHTALFEQDLIA